MDKEKDMDKIKDKKGGDIMPGFNQRGPENQGPMTGRRQGRCADNDNAGDFGRRCQGGRSRRGNRGMANAQWNRPAQQTPNSFVDNKEALKQRAQNLENELQAIKQELNNLSNS